MIGIKKAYLFLFSLPFFTRSLSVSAVFLSFSPLTLSLSFFPLLFLSLFLSLYLIFLYPSYFLTCISYTSTYFSFWKLLSIPKMHFMRLSSVIRLTCSNISTELSPSLIIRFHLACFKTWEMHFLHTLLGCNITKQERNIFSVPTIMGALSIRYYSEK